MSVTFKLQRSANSHVATRQNVGSEDVENKDLYKATELY